MLTVVPVLGGRIVTNTTGEGFARGRRGHANDGTRRRASAGMPPLVPGDGDEQWRPPTSKHIGVIVA